MINKYYFDKQIDLKTENLKHPGISAFCNKSVGKAGHFYLLGKGFMMDFTYHKHMGWDASVSIFTPETVGSVYYDMRKKQEEDVYTIFTDKSLESIKKEFSKYKKIHDNLF